MNDPIHSAVHISPRYVGGFDWDGGREYLWQVELHGKPIGQLMPHRDAVVVMDWLRGFERMGGTSLESLCKLIGGKL